jgi:hypothetical protein
LISKYRQLAWRAFPKREGKLTGGRVKIKKYRKIKPEKSSSEKMTRYCESDCRGKNFLFKKYRTCKKADFSGSLKCLAHDTEMSELTEIVLKSLRINE